MLSSQHPLGEVLVFWIGWFPKECCGNCLVAYFWALWLCILDDLLLPKCYDFWRFGFVILLLDIIQWLGTEHSARVNAMRMAVLDTFPEPNRRLLQRYQLSLSALALLSIMIFLVQIIFSMQFLHLFLSITDIN